MNGFASRNWVSAGLPGTASIPSIEDTLLHQHEFPADVLSHGNALSIVRNLHAWRRELHGFRFCCGNPVIEALQGKVIVKLSCGTFGPALVAHLNETTVGG
jgi:hypothetical protein